MAGQEVFHVRAYERKEEMGGGFRCRVSQAGAAVFESEVMSDQVAAFRAGYDFVMEKAAGRGVGVGHYRGNRFVKNYFVHN